MANRDGVKLGSARASCVEIHRHSSAAAGLHLLRRLGYLR
ncbi:hypothetical protein TIFTF001_013429 [Ficus carica]|uniref:Uncharacterized protein n=1 Tax=Ficus carica TaxID=3494 RepID=A0AA88A219_FICCA|nr:hypothetical protein TIFTF001_013429 [Ficus carica]